MASQSGGADNVSSQPPISTNEQTGQTNEIFQSTSVYNVNKTLLEQLNDEIFVELIPAVVYLVLLMVVGTVGNVSVIYIFSVKLKTTPQTFLFVWLAVFDVISCVIGMPSEIADIRLYFFFENALACKLLRFVETIPPVSSANLLVVIAVDRYRRVCKPLNDQMEMVHAKIGVALSAFVAFVIAGPSFSLYGNRIVTTSVPGLHGCDCSVQDKYQGRMYPLLYELAFGAAFVVYTTVLVVIYSRIWLETRRHRQYIRSHKINSIALASLLASDTDSSCSRTPKSAQKVTPKSEVFVSTQLRNLSLGAERETLPPSQSQSFDQLSSNLPIVPETEDSEKQMSNSPGLAVALCVPENLESKIVAVDPELPFNGNGRTKSCVSFNISTDSDSLESSSPEMNTRVTYNRKASLTASKNSVIFQATDSPGATTRKASRLQLLPSEISLKLRTALKANKLTMVSVAVTGVFILSYLPHLVLVIVGTVFTDFEYSQEGYKLVLYNIFIRSYFINSVANVFIYGATNTVFRTHFKCLWCKQKVGTYRARCPGNSEC